MTEQIKQGVEKVKDAFNEQLSRFGKFWDIIQGHQDSQVRADVILSPKTPQTTTNLSSNQVDFVVICSGISKKFPELAPLEEGCKEFLYSSISKDGFGVTSMIQYEQAIGEKRLLQLRAGNTEATNQQKDKKKTEKE